MGHRDGLLRHLRRPLPDLRRDPGSRPDHPRRRLRAGLPAAARGPDLGPSPSAAQDRPHEPLAPDHLGDSRDCRGRAGRERRAGQDSPRRRQTNPASPPPEAPAPPGERPKKPLSEEEKAALPKAAAARESCCGEGCKGSSRVSGRGSGPQARLPRPSPKHEEDPNKPVWKRDPVAPDWQDGASDPLTVAIKEEFTDVIESARSFAGDLTFQVRRDAIAQVAASLKNRHKFTYKIIHICGADYPKREPRFDVVYHLHSFEANRRIRLKVLHGRGHSGAHSVRRLARGQLVRARGLRHVRHPFRRAIRT